MNDITLIHVDSKLLQALNNITTYLKIKRDSAGLLIFSRALRIIAEYLEECQNVKQENELLKLEIERLKGPSLGGKSKSNKGNGENNGPSNLVN